MGCFDLQVNGYGGVDFNKDNLTADEMRTAINALQRDGADGILATIITEKLDLMCSRIAKIVSLCNADPSARQMIKGIHVEGPFISGKTGYVGAHPKDSVLPATPEVAKRLIDAGNGWVRLVTLAPEVDEGARTTAYLAKQGVCISAGHTNASRDELVRAMDAGLSLFTHLGNGCPPELPRHDNIVQRALSLRDRLFLMFIADGAHIPTFALKNYIDLVGIDRCIVVTDAIAPAGLGPGRYSLGRWDLTIGEDLVARSPDGSHLVGSAMSMPLAIANLESKVGLTASQAQQLVDTNPKRAVSFEQGN